MMSKKKVLVVGGAGYIGSHTCLVLAERGYEPVVFDNLSNGHAEFVRWGELEQGDIRDHARLDEVFAKHKPEAVLHFAALIEVGESVKNPVGFYDNNVVGALTLMSAAMQAGVKAFVFSSTCATYGLPVQVPMDESHGQSPINPYGRTKYIIEQALKDYGQYMDLKSVMLRYFNAAGADFEGRIGEWHTPETHAIPLAIEAALGRAVDYLLAGGEMVELNLGTGTGTTVKELLAAISDVSGKPFPVEYVGRREGDSTSLVANNDKAREVLGWEPQYSLNDIIKSAWDWHSRSNHVLQ